ncbi:MAG: Holliday junction branch migration protein RuvA [Clostridiales bacterium]|nr:Holliday junction branch migration protein RuvA [Clostridiales bacterium]MBQ3046939.1 Holliday junction branch migration protein RuvA [Clostridia bacterium]
MIGYIKGNLLTADNGVVILENNGIGYEITCSASVYNKLLTDKKGEVYTYLAVREDGVSLYGFESLEEKGMFLKLISVSGVGPKMGITVLSNMNLKDLAIKIATSDVKGLSSVKGLGKKTAERIILELREKITADGEAVETSTKQPTETLDGTSEDAIIALMSLGFTKAECVQAVKDAKNNGAETIEQIIAYSIKHIK